MQTSIARNAALVAYGNHALRGHGLSEAFDTLKIFSHCKSVSFVTLGTRNGVARRDTYAGDPAQWFARLRDEKVGGLRLHRQVRTDPAIDSRMSSAFVGGGDRWLIEAIKPVDSDLWEGREELGDRHDVERKIGADRKIWVVTYGRTLAGYPHSRAAAENMQALHDSVGTVLTDAAAFADRQRVSEFARMFRSGLRALEAERPLDDEAFAEYAPRQAVSPAGQQLLAAACTSWVFGGMGSWNDLGFHGSDQALYESLSARLFTKLCEAIVAGVNTSCDVPRPGS